MIRKALFFARTRPRQASRVAFLIWVLICTPALRAESPQWFRDAVHTAVSGYAPETQAVVVFDEQITQVGADGQLTTTQRRAIKILTAAGRDYATAYVPFDSQTKVLSFRGWSQPASGKEFELSDKDAYERSMSSEALYSDDRIKLMRLPAEVGSVVGYEYVQRGRPDLLLDSWDFASQLEVPVMSARYTLSLPSGWEMDSFWIHHPKVEPQQNGNSYTWQVSNIPGTKPEDSMPVWRAVTPRMEVVLVPPNGGTEVALTSWNRIGAWYFRLADSRRQPSAQIAEVTAQLTAGKTTELDKIRAIAAFMQREIRYVAIEVGIGGYQPHDAAQTFANRYGDCKDKVALMSAMLKSAGITSYYVVAHADRGVVVPEAPTPRSFNHMIIAVKLPATETVPAEFSSVIAHPTLGKLLIFDPTDAIVPVGQLPPGEQGNHGLLVTDAGGELIALPLPKPALNGLQRSAHLELGLDGRLTGEVREVRSGALARAKRYELRSLAVAQRRKALEDFLSPFLSRFSVQDFKIENLDDYEKDLVITYSFSALGYTKNMGALTLLRPRVFGSKTSRIDFNGKERRYPFALDEVSAQTDEFSFRLPEGLTVDELPPPAELQGPGLRYQSKSTVSGHTLTYQRSFEVDEVTVPVEKSAELKKFYAALSADERSSAVLKRQ